MVEKDSFGIKFTFYAALSFVLAICGQTLLCGLLVAFAILVEKDQWMIRQVMQALLLCLVGFIPGVLSGILDILYYIPGIYSALRTTIDVIGNVLDILVFVLGLLAAARCAKGQEAKVPVFSGIANKAYGFVQQ